MRYIIKDQKKSNDKSHDTCKRHCVIVPRMPETAALCCTSEESVYENKREEISLPKKVAVLFPWKSLIMSQWQPLVNL